MPHQLFKCQSSWTVNQQHEFASHSLATQDLYSLFTLLLTLSLAYCWHDFFTVTATLSLLSHINLSYLSFLSRPTFKTPSTQILHTVIIPGYVTFPPLPSPFSTIFSTLFKTLPINTIFFLHNLHLIAHHCWVYTSLPCLFPHSLFYLFINSHRYIAAYLLWSYIILHILSEVETWVLYYFLYYLYLQYFTYCVVLGIL